MNSLLKRLPPPAEPGTGRVFLWDNLRSHYNPLVANNVNLAGHSIIPRPPYQPCDGPVEYAFNYLEGRLKERMYQIKNLNDLEMHIHQIIGTITAAQITNTFALNCGYL